MRAALAVAILLGASGCGHKQNQVRVAPPQASPPEAARAPAATSGSEPAIIPVTPLPPG
jgi:hypothetical protein